MTEAIPFIISEFDNDSKNLTLLIRECFGAEFPDIHCKRQIRYITNYLSGLGAKTIVCETKYIDKDYLADYQAYYATCLNCYPKHTARLHFFKSNFNHDDFLNWIKKNNIEKLKELNENYLGFSIIKPLPVTFLGKTCLKVYPKRIPKKLLLKTYKASLFGIQLEVESIAFQEQDKGVSACATTSLWVLMHATEHFYYNNVPSLSEITLKATDSIKSNINSFPNAGLSNLQLITALESYQLKLHYFKFDNTNISLKQVNELIITHLNSNIPILSGCSVFSSKKTGENTYTGEHAVTVLGYCTDTDGKLDHLYLHDDRIGPYVKAKLIKSGFKSDKSYTSSLKFHYELIVDGHDTKELIAIESIKMGSYHKIRIPYSLIKGVCNKINDLATVSFLSSPEENDVKTKASFIHNIELIPATQLKMDTLTKNNVQNKSEFILCSLSKYVWRCSFTLVLKEENNSHKFPIIELIYDTTDIPLGNELSHIIKYENISNNFLGMLTEVYKKHTNPVRTTDEVENSFYLSTLRAIAQKTESHNDLLSQFFGALRPPKRINNQEIQNHQPIQNNKEYIIRQPRNSLQKDFKNHDTDKLIWVISKNGSILIGPDNKGKGHPTLTGASPARVAGEVAIKIGYFELNTKSGRYSSNYNSTEQENYLKNVLQHFSSLFPDETFRLKVNNN